MRKHVSCVIRKWFQIFLSTFKASRSFLQTDNARTRLQKPRMKSASITPLERSAVSTGGVTAWCIDKKASRGDVIAFKALVRAECIHRTSMGTPLPPAPTPAKSRLAVGMDSIACY